MEIIQAIILGIVQGITEFLPISSSAHLVLVPWIFGWEDPGLTFNVALHFGTLIAVVSYFWHDWISIFKLVLSQNSGNALLPLAKGEEKVRRASESTFSEGFEAKKYHYTKNMLWFIVLATIPGILAGYFFNDYAETVFRNPLIIATTLFIFGLLLYLVDKYFERLRNLKKLSWKNSLLVGLAQAIAIIPGTSRSGITMTAGRALKYNRVSAARFSFLLATPVILGATVFKTKDFFVSAVATAEIFGILAAAISGYLAIAWLIKFIEKSSYAIFFWYRFALAVLIIILWLAN